MSRSATAGWRTSSCRSSNRPGSSRRSCAVVAPTEAPDLTARICGICPVAYQMSACAAVEAALGMSVDPGVADLRRLLYCGEWLQSHSLHVHMLHAPDFLGCQDAVEMAQQHRPDFERGLALKKMGNRIMETVGGRAIHPVNVKVGGFYRAPSKVDVAALAGPLSDALERAVATVAWVAGFDFPDVHGDYRFVALRDAGRYPLESGRVASSDGLDTTPAGFADLVVEEHVARSTALHARLENRLEYLTGPLARYALNSAQLPEVAARAAADAGLGATCTNPFQSIIVRAVEIVFACEEALALVERYEPPDPPSTPVPPGGGQGTGATEAPRGLPLPPLPHRSGRTDLRRADRAPHVPEPDHDRVRHPPDRPGVTRPERRRAHVEERAGGSQPRPVHLVRHTLPRPHHHADDDRGARPSRRDRGRRAASIGGTTARARPCWNACAASSRDAEVLGARWPRRSTCSRHGTVPGSPSSSTRSAVGHEPGELHVVEVDAGRDAAARPPGRCRGRAVTGSG